MTPHGGYRSKIVTLEALSRISRDAKARGRRRVLCHGKFEVMHPGHTRHLEWASRQGDMLLVTIAEDTAEWASQVPVETRLENLAALSMVDHVASVPCLDATRSIAALQPDVLVRGIEYRTFRRQLAEREKAELGRYGGELLFSPGSASLGLGSGADRDLGGASAHQASLLTLIERHDIKISHLEEVLTGFSGLEVAVVGDCIVDEYLFCDALGMSAEDPVIVVRPRSKDRFVGGAAIVAEHAHALGARSHYFSVLGADATGEFVREHGSTVGVEYHVLADASRPTTVKQRFLAGGKKLLRVSYLEERPISDNLADELVRGVEEVIGDLDLVIMSDFSYGVNSPQVRDRICALAREHDVRVTADVQCSSQIATVARYKGIDLITPTEREARMSLFDMDGGLTDIGMRLLEQTGNKDLIIKLGENGLLIFKGQWEKGVLADARTEYLTSFADEVRDPMGAGDALLAACSLALAAGGDIFEASILGNVAAAIEVLRVGNVPVTRLQLESKLTGLLEPLLEVKS
ncbi:MAG: ADP-heptose synthase [Planctomycetes bacterium]|nr:ADP-heptose synthase [Planctomycetota bacterium]